MKHAGLIFLLSISVLANAENPCDCSQQIGSCEAVVTLHDKWFTLKSNHKDCSRVDWLVDGQPRVTVVLDHEEKVEWLGQKAPEYTVQSCVVCKDSRTTVAIEKTIDATGICRGLQDLFVQCFGAPPKEETCGEAEVQDVMRRWKSGEIEQSNNVKSAQLRSKAAAAEGAGDSGTAKVYQDLIASNECRIKKMHSLLDGL